MVADIVIYSLNQQTAIKTNLPILTALNQLIGGKIVPWQPAEGNFGTAVV